MSERGHGAVRVAAVIIAAALATERPAVHGVVRASVVNVGDVGRGLPTLAEVSACQANPAAEVIYSPALDTWTCEQD